MTELEEIKDILWLYTTYENHPTQAEEAFANLKDFGDQVIDGLIWGLQQGDINLKLLVLELLQYYYTDAKRALPAVRALISDYELRLVRVTAINTAGILGDTSDELIPLLEPRLDSEDAFERIFSAGNLWRICRSEDAYVVLRREAAAGDDEPFAIMARSYLKDVD